MNVVFKLVFGSLGVHLVGADIHPNDKKYIQYLKIYEYRTTSTETYTNHAQFIFCFGVFDDFLFFSCSQNYFFGVLVFSNFAISFATGGVNRKLQNWKKRGHQKTISRARKNKKSPKTQKFELL